MIDIDYEKAACLGIEDPEILFPDGGTNHQEMVETAKAICASCAVVLQCLNHGLHHEKVGIWGGLTPTELAEMRKRDNIILVPISNK
jgi:hypothetical protein